MGIPIKLCFPPGLWRAYATTATARGELTVAVDVELVGGLLHVGAGVGVATMLAHPRVKLVLVRVPKKALL